MPVRLPKVMRLLLRVTVVVMELHMSPVEELLSAVVMLLTVLCVDQLISATLEQARGGDFDAHTIAFAALVSRPLGLARSMWPPPTSSGVLVSSVMGAAWSAVGLMVTAVGKRARDDADGGWNPAIINAECALGVMLTHAPFEPTWMYAARVYAFTFLSMLLYAGGPLGRNCYIAERGYLVCFCPVLFAEPWTALSFTLASVLFMYRNDALYRNVGSGRGLDIEAESEVASGLI